MKNLKYKNVKNKKKGEKMLFTFAADFADRVVHHLLIHEIEPYYEKCFINDLYNNRKEINEKLIVKNEK